MKLRQLVFIGLLFISCLIQAQTDFRPGYVIKTNGDTLIGEIDYRIDQLMGRRCRFETNNKEILFTPDDIDSYRFYGSKYFIAQPVNGKKIFLEYLLKGKIDLYYLRDEKGDHYFLEKDNSGIVEIPYSEGIKHMDGKDYYYETKKHTLLLNHYMYETPELQKRIALMGKPEHKNLIKLAEDYHNIVCKDYSCITYEKQTPIKIDFEVAGGPVAYQDNNSFQAGILMHLWMPRTSENIYFRTGILSSILDFDSIQSRVYKIPIHLEYNYPKGRFRPIFAYGINIYSRHFFPTVAFMGGLNIKLHRSISLGITYDVDFISKKYVPLIPQTLFSQSLMSGFIVKL